MTQQEAGDVAEPARVEQRGSAKRLKLVQAALAAAVSGTLVVTFDISLAALVFTHDFADRLSKGIGIFLVSSVIVGVIVALLSSFRPVIAAPQEDAAVIFASMASAIAAGVHKVDPNADAFPTVIVAIALTSVVAGGFFLLLGILRLGVLVRFIPYPVAGGFLAGAGWLLVQGSLSVMSGKPATLPMLPELFASSLDKVLTGLLFGLLLVALLRRYTNLLLLPILLVGSTGVFYLMLTLAGSSVTQAFADGWLLGPFPREGLWPPVEASDLQKVNWPVLFDSGGNMVAVTVMAAITVLLSASGVELATEQEIDLDRELRATGVANIVGSMFGCVVGYMSMPESSMNFKTGANTRLAGLFAASVSALVLIIGADAISYYPRPVLGGLIAYLGFHFLINTLYEGYFRLRRTEYLVVVLILLVVAVWGFLLGVAVGLGVSLILFALSYSRIEVIRNAISGVHLRSNVARSDGEEMTLMERAKQLYILQLQGYVFFGTAYNLLTSAQQRIQSTDAEIRYLLLDFRHVNGLDSSAIASFLRLRRLAKANSVRLILTEVPADIRNHLERGEVVIENDDVCRIYPDLDRGLEACENEIIQEAPPSMLPPPMLFYDLQDVFNGREDMLRFLGYLERVEAPAGFDLFRQGDISKDLYLIESGELTAWLEIDGRKIKRLRTMGPGSVVGESGLYMGEKRSATVTASRQATLYRLSEEALRRLTDEAPELAAAFHHFVVTLLARRIVHSTGPVKSLFN
ncbi:SulP family inorganic anion transporter [Sorangium cellulosum]|uniref:SulP family inorganic anion transporter n=1 Tax=Sorangium cellulosum TaxID=56 RepID=UPI000B0C0619|nr:SulP family inorganic anion transporter [Sorangium cellulosum]